MTRQPWRWRGCCYAPAGARRRRAPFYAATKRLHILKRHEGFQQGAFWSWSLPPAKPLLAREQSDLSPKIPSPHEGNLRNLRNLRKPQRSHRGIVGANVKGKMDGPERMRSMVLHPPVPSVPARMISRDTRGMQSTRRSPDERTERHEHVASCPTRPATARGARLPVPPLRAPADAAPAPCHSTRVPIAGRAGASVHRLPDPLHRD